MVIYALSDDYEIVLCWNLQGRNWLQSWWGSCLGREMDVSVQDVGIVHSKDDEDIRAPLKYCVTVTDSSHVTYDLWLLAVVAVAGDPACLTGLSCLSVQSPFAFAFEHPVHKYEVYLHHGLSFGTHECRLFGKCWARTLKNPARWFSSLHSSTKRRHQFTMETRHVPTRH